MNYWIKLLVTVALAVSIPLQGFAAVMMPACNSSSASINANVSTSVHSTSMAMDHATTQSMPCDDGCCKPASNSHQCSDQKCFTCHLSVFALPNTHLLVLADNTAMIYRDTISGSYHIYSPPLFHPPKSTSA